MIMEYNVTDDFKFGIEALALDTPSQSKDTVAVGSLSYQDNMTIMDNVQNGIFPGGLTIGLAKGTYTDSEGRVRAAGFPGIINFDAMKKDGNFKVVSQTGLEAQNNKEASVNIVNQIPILKSTIQGGSGTARDVIQNIERLDVGIKLKLTPRIIPNGEIQVMLSPSIEAVIDQGPSGQYTPTIARREVSTTVTVKDGKTIIIAGLTRQDNTEMIKKLPILGYIPLIGKLFTYKATNNEKTNMLIFVTPKSVADQASADALRKTWQDKTGLTNTTDSVKQ
jgi:type II secretory pathway component GspD/PulD (secretin)